MMYCQKLRVAKVRCQILEWHKRSWQKIEWKKQSFIKYLRYFAASPFPLQGKTNACSRGRKKDFWRRCQGELWQVKTYQVPIINSSPSHYIIFHSPLIFLSPLLKRFSKTFAFSSPLFN